MTKIALKKKYKTYHEYKNSGVEWVGTMPAHWRIERSKFLFRHRNERARQDDRQMTASQEYGVIPQEEFFKLSGYKVIQVLTGFQILKHVEPNDFVISMRSFQGGIELSKGRGCVSSAYVILAPSQNVYPAFYAHLLKSRSYINALQLTSNLVRDGQALRFQNFAQVDLPTLPYEEQKRIADFLDEKTVLIDRIIEKKQRLIELLKEKRAAVINHAVTKGLDPRAKMVNSDLPWVGKIPSSWELVPNKVFLRKVKDQVGDQYSKFPLLSLTKQGVILRDTEENKGKFSADMSTFQIVNAGNLVFCLFDIQETPRTVGLSQLRGMITGAYSVFACADPSIAKFVEYFYIAMDDQKRLSYLYSGLRNTITPPKFLRVHTPIPPRETRLAIVDYIEVRTRKIDAALCGVENSIRMLQEFKSSLIAHAVTGKIKI